MIILMKKRTRILFILLIITLILGIYFIGRTVYIRQICPLWDIDNKTCYSCNYPNLVWVDPKFPNHCPQRQILEGCCKNGTYRSILKDYVDEYILHCEYYVNNVMDGCMRLDRSLSMFLNIRSITLILLFFLTPIFVIFRKTRWLGFCTFSAIGSIIFAGNIVDYGISIGGVLSDFIAAEIISVFVVLLPILTDFVRLITKRITQKKFAKDLLIWFLCSGILFILLYLLAYDIITNLNIT